MSKAFEVRWEKQLAATPQQVWDAVTVHTAGWLWKIEFEPWVGGAERGLSGVGRVTVWEPQRRFVTRAEFEGNGFNQLDYTLESRDGGTCVRYVHTTTFAEDDYDREADACRRHTAFYSHTLGEYVRHFAGRDAAYVGAEAPPASAEDGFARMRAALGLTDIAAGDRVRLTPAGLAPIDGIVDYLSEAFLGIRTTDALYRFYGRDAWGWPAGVAHHLFAEDVDESAQERAWTTWLNGVFAVEAVEA